MLGAAPGAEEGISVPPDIACSDCLLGFDRVTQFRARENLRSSKKTPDRVELRGIEFVAPKNEAEPFSRADDNMSDGTPVVTAPSAAPSGQAESLQTTDVSLRTQLAALLGVDVDALVAAIATVKGAR
jgi:hypothetical protein